MKALELAVPRTTYMAACFRADRARHRTMYGKSFNSNLAFGTGSLPTAKDQVVTAVDCGGGRAHRASVIWMVISSQTLGEGEFT
jgi:hypothetical protein